jgi:hypothetical protein
MNEEMLTKLSQALIESKFSFMPRGTFNTKTIYEVVQKRYPELCNDKYLCIEHCKSGHNQPEWKHRVRGVLDNLKKRSAIVRPNPNRGSWDFI